MSVPTFCRHGSRSPLGIAYGVESQPLCFFRPKQYAIPWVCSALVLKSLCPFAGLGVLSEEPALVLKSLCPFAGLGVLSEEPVLVLKSLFPCLFLQARAT